MRRIKDGRIIPFTLVTIILLAVIVIKMNPPLRISGTSWDIYDERYRVIAIENNGFAGVSLRKVQVNGTDPKQVELGISKAHHLVLGINLDNKSYISFHPITAYKIKPELSPKEMAKKVEALEVAGESEHIFYYGIRINHSDPVRTVTIKYSYLGIPFKLTADYGK